ncbi:translation initiation factor SUI1, putative [Trypanosoma equiperdum]|uniref:SUI1 domain-containing protein n=2 Tax=Trypanozoon TaxID=39700 RepID=Q57Y82_TRYB2|nr:hypothetical protein, conserved [Trypanosoma brucei brucei TREU927]AAX69408.1 hypothetical protein, conserved [Trypanosoma brucei]AAZ12336.1 hypothetical protein, conserved [Trypanosoma brucei brucei TREU927]SCU67440.1 translation initiation factor SUI1, putative [Trypanosoma equiperdum]
MFHKKYVVKGQVSVSKKESKCLWDNIYGIVGEDNLSCLDSFWRRNDSVVRTLWEFSGGGSAVLYSINKVPLVISVNRLSEDADSVCLENQFTIVPTLFMLSLMRCYYKKEDTDFGSLFGARVFCHGPTSRFILSGAHLMLPGIIERRTQTDTPVRKGDLVFIYSLGNLFPYAVGLATDGLAGSNQRGKGVYVIHSYKDGLWNLCFDAFHEYCSSSISVVPSTFRDSEVVEIVSSQMHPVCERTRGETSLNGEADLTDDAAGASCEDERVMKAALSLLEDEDNVLDFALCEAIRELNVSALPLPVGEFVPLLLSNYPRFPNVQMRFDFKGTKYRKALSYLTVRDETLIISEEKKGEHFIVSVNKKSDLYRTHRRSYADFLKLFHIPLKEEERLVLEQQALRGGVKKGLQRRIKSVEALYSPRGRSLLNIQLFLCTGILLEQGGVVSGTVNGSSDKFDNHKGSGDDDEYLDDLYSKKQLCDMLRSYISSKNILNISGDRSGIPCVLLDEFLGPLVRGSVKEIPITELEELILQKLFVPVHKITLETSAVITGGSSSAPTVTQLTKRGTLPKVLIYTEKRSGNKIVTAVKHLDDFGFDLFSLSNKWKHQFSTSCSIFDPSKGMQNLKPGTKIALEVHLGGNWLVKLKKLLEVELGFPHHLIAERCA